MSKKMILFVLSGMLCLIISGCGGGSGGSSGSSGSTNLSGKVWRDRNQDKIVNDGETGIPSVKLNLYRDSNGNNTLESTDELAAATNADWDGNYSFNVTATGTYFVSLDTQSGMNWMVLTTESADTITGPSFVALRINVTNLGVAITNLNFGFLNGTNISGKVWIDQNQDKIVNAGEAGIPSVKLNLFRDSNGNNTFDSTDAFVATTNTDLDGNYSFQVTATGTYFISLDTQPGINGMPLTTVSVDTIFTGPSFVALRINVTNIGGNIGGLNFGFVNGTNLSGKVWKDLNKDKTINPGEPGIPGVKVDLYKDSNQNGSLDFTDESVTTMTTDSNGNYSFTVTSTGRYFISIESTPAIAGWILTTNNDDPNVIRIATLRVDVVNLNTGIQNLSFGFFNPIKWNFDIYHNAVGVPNWPGRPGSHPFPFVSSPALAPDGTIYIGSGNNFLYAMNPYGTMKWKYETGASIGASPAVGSDGTIYFGSVDRQIYALNPDGTLKWIVPTKSVFVSSAAIATDGTIYVAGTNLDRTILCSDTLPQVVVTLGTLYAINPNGTIKWTRTLSGVVYSSPAVATDGTIYIGSEGDIDYDSSNPCNIKYSPESQNTLPPSNANPSFPVNGHVYAVNANGTLKWDFKTLGDVDSSPAIGNDGTIYVGSHYPDWAYGATTKISDLIPVGSLATGYLYAINPGGTIKWTKDLFGAVDSSPAIGSDGTIYVGSDDNHVWAVNPNSTTKWVSPTRDHVKSSPALAADGTIYIGSNDGSLYAFNADGTVKSRSAMGGEVNSSPTIGMDGSIYFATGGGDDKLYSMIGDSVLAEAPWPKFRRDLPNTGRK